MSKLTKFERWCRDDPSAAAHTGALAYLRRQQKRDAAFERVVNLLARIRFCKWPLPNLGIDITAEDIDDVLIDADRIPYPRKPNVKKRKSS